LFLTPEEVRPPPILRRFHQILETAVLRPWAAAGDGLHWVLSDPQVRDVHLALLPPGNAPDDPLARHRLQGLRLKLQSLGEHALLPKEKRELLCDADSIKMLGGNFSVGHEKTPHRVSPRN
jgi:hypothetical protein